MSGHTPGPWEAQVVRQGASLYPAVYGANERLVADAWHYQKDDAEMIANARLIAAAPDLLVACERMMDDVLTYHEDAERGEYDRYGVDIPTATIRALRAAITKARGEAQP